MKMGTVTGRVWATKRHELLPAGGLVHVEFENGVSVIALDSFGVGVGEVALVMQGSVAAQYCGSPVDAVVVAVVDPSGDK